MWRVARRQTTTQGEIATIHTNGHPDEKNQCCHWSWVALETVTGGMRAEKGHIRLLASTARQFLSQTKATTALVSGKENKAAKGANQ
jgi:hypothetical protein